MVFFFSKKPVVNKKKVPPKEDYDAIMSLFNRCDVDRNGKLSKEEVKAGFRKLQSRFPAFRAQRAFQIADENGDGYISEGELDKLVTYALECYQDSNYNIKLRLI